MKRSFALPCTTNSCCLVRDEPAVVEKWKNLVKNAMESAEAKWLGAIPAVADVNVGRASWAGNALVTKLNLK